MIYFRQRDVRLKIAVAPDKPIEKLTNNGWQLVGSSPDNTNVEIKRTFNSEDKFVQEMKVVDDSPFRVIEAQDEGSDEPFYQLNQTPGLKIAPPETLFQAAIDLVIATQATEGVSATIKPKEDGDKETKPAEPPAPAPQEVLTGVPNIPKEVWALLPEPDAETAAKALVEKATAFETNRMDRAAWAPTRETALIAHLDAGHRSEVAKRLLEESGEISAEHVTARQTRNLMLKAAVDITDSINAQIKKWTKLADDVVPMLMVTTAVSGALIIACLVFLFLGRLNGLEMALLAFVFTLAAVSPATLLLVGRPLKGLDEWTPAGAKKEEAAAKDEGTKTSDAKSK